MTEKTLLTRFIKAFRDEPDVVVVRKDQSVLSQRGVSDLIVCDAGEFCAVELKQDNGKLTKLQDKFLCDVQMAGGRAFVCYGEEAMKCLINWIIARDPIPSDILQKDTWAPYAVLRSTRKQSKKPRRKPTSSSV